MNRRSFFKRTIGVIAAAVVAPFVPVAVTQWKSRLWASDGSFERLTFNGKPLVFDECAPSNTVYFLSKDGPMALNGPVIGPLGESYEIKGGVRISDLRHGRRLGVLT